MKLHPNPPRLVTVGLAVALAVIGFIYAWPLDGLIPVLAPVADALAGIGLDLNREWGTSGSSRRAACWSRAPSCRASER